MAQADRIGCRGGALRTSGLRTPPLQRDQLGGGRDILFIRLN
jgi:hypothetical protein